MFSENILWVQLSAHKMFSWDLGCHKKFYAKIFCGLLLVLQFGFAKNILWELLLPQFEFSKTFCGSIFRAPQTDLLEHILWVHSDTTNRFARKHFVGPPSRYHKWVCVKTFCGSIFGTPQTGFLKNILWVHFRGTTKYFA